MSSNSSWYPDAPDEWRVMPLKFAVRAIGSGGTPATADLDFWTDDESGTPWVAIADMSQTDCIKVTEKRVTPAGLHSKGLTVYTPGTLLYSMYASVGKVSRLDIFAAINQAILAIEPDEHQCRTTYLRWLLEYVTQRILAETNNNTQDNLNLSKVRNARILLPPTEEQDQIAAFLDRETARADALVAKYERLINLLEEKRTALITEAVTKGLDPTVKMKDSGIEWLGAVPKHWSIAQLRRFWKVIDCKHVTVAFSDEGIPLASVREVQDFDLALSNANRTSAEWYLKMIEGGREPRRGDIIYCRNVSVGQAAYVNTDEKFAMGQDVCLIHSNVDGRFLNYYLHSSAMSNQMQTISVGVTFDRINVADIRRLVITWPPIAEQLAIVAYLDESVSSIAALKSTLERAIELVREHRSALITGAVTGQVDVHSYNKAMAYTEEICS